MLSRPYNASWEYLGCTYVFKIDVSKFYLMVITFLVKINMVTYLTYMEKRIFLEEQ